MADTKKRRSLAEVLSQEPRKVRTGWIYSIPERDEIDQAYRQWEEESGSQGKDGKRKSPPHRRIQEWLIKDCGYSPDVATYARVTSYFSSGEWRERS